MKLTHKWIVEVFSVVLVIVIVGLYGLKASDTIGSFYSGLSNEFQEDVISANQSSNYIKGAEGHLFLFLMLGQEKDKDKFFQRYKSLDEQIEKLKKTVTTTGGTRELEVLTSASFDMLIFANLLIAAYEQNPEAFSFKNNAELIKSFHEATSSGRNAAVEIANRRTLDASIESSSYIKRAEGHLFLYLMLGQEKDKDKFFQRRKSLEDQIDILDIALTESEEQQNLEVLKSASIDVLSFGNQLIAAYEQNPEAFSFKNNAELIKSFHEAISSGRNAAVEIATLESQKIKGGMTKVSIIADSIKNNIIIVIIIAIVVLTLAGVYKYYSITVPIVNLSKAVNGIAKGKSVSIDIRPKNEVGELARNFIQMTENLKKANIQREKLTAELKRLSLTDDLTGLYNRRGFFNLADHLLRIAKREKKGLFMLYADLDGLKGINDSLGHREGDQALIDIANILKENYRESDIIARLGGDEFAVIPVGTTGDSIEIIKSRLQDKLDIHNAKRIHRYDLSVSAGITYYDPETPLSLDDFLAQADELMYEEKRRKQNS